MAKSYLEQRREMKLKGPKPASLKRGEAKKKGDFFKTMIAAAPSNCKNCNKYLVHTAKINPSAIVAHILPKSEKQGVPSMSEDPRNIVYLCGDCHTNMDTKGCDFMAGMKIYELMKRRVISMWDEIPSHERRRVPECLRPKGH